MYDLICLGAEETVYELEIQFRTTFSHKWVVVGIPQLRSDRREFSNAQQVAKEH